jgi:hypothetical protein
MVWLVLSTTICAIDAAFVLLRPWSMTATDQPWPTWQHYATLDKRYASMTDGFVWVCAWGNLLEGALGIFAVLLSFGGAKALAHKVAIAVSAMTLYKTAMYFALDHVEGYVTTGHAAQGELFLNVYLPSSFWVLMPLVVVVQAWRRLRLGEVVVFASKKREGKTLGYAVSGLSKVAIVWTLISVSCGAVDTAFVLLRPWSLSTTEQPWATWQVYASFDTRYASMTDGLVVVFAYCTIAEGVLGLLAIATSVAGAHGFAHKTAIVASVMTIYKTLMYFGVEHAEGNPFTKHADPVGFLQNVTIPASFWIILPAFIMSQAFRQLRLGAASAFESAKKAQ